MKSACEAYVMLYFGAFLSVYGGMGSFLLLFEIIFEMNIDDLIN